MSRAIIRNFSWKGGLLGFFLGTAIGVGLWSFYVWFFPELDPEGLLLAFIVIPYLGTWIALFLQHQVLDPLGFHAPAKYLLFQYHPVLESLVPILGSIPLGLIGFFAGGLLAPCLFKN